MVNNQHITLIINIDSYYVKEDDKGNKEKELNGINQDIKNDNDVPIEKAHQITTDVQNLILKNTDASRVIVHAEPN